MNVELLRFKEAAYSAYKKLHLTVQMTNEQEQYFTICQLKCIPASHWSFILFRVIFH